VDESNTSESVILGPQAIEAVAYAVESLLPWLRESQFRVRADGNLEFRNPEPAEAVRILRAAVEDVIPEGIRTTIGESSGLGWNIFFGHVVAWWLPQRRTMGFLRALTDRAALHSVNLQLHWNRGRAVKTTYRVPGNEAVVWGAVLGLISAGVAIRLFYIGGIPAALIAAGGLVAGRIYRRVVRNRVCGDSLCRAPTGRAQNCPFCGAELIP